MKESPAKNQKISFKKITRRWGFPIATLVITLLLIGYAFYSQKKKSTILVSEVPSTPIVVNPNVIPLPTPIVRSNFSVEAALKSRRTRREFLPNELSLKQISQVLWAGQGVTTDWGGRTAPSAKSTYPLTIYLIANKVERLENGFYRYIPGDRLPAHQLLPLKFGDFQNTIYEIVNQSSAKDSPALLLITGNISKMNSAYGDSDHSREVYLEAGHVAENIYLQVESLKLGTVVLTTLDEIKLKDLLSIPDNETIIYLMPVGLPKE